jgi:hypothetical protein
MQFKEEVKLISRAANTVGEEEGVPLQPLHGLGWVLETDAGTAHREVGGDGVDVDMECQMTGKKIQSQMMEVEH